MPNSALFMIRNDPAKTELEQEAKDMGLEHSVSALEAIACGIPVVHLYEKQNEDQYVEGVTGFAFQKQKWGCLCAERRSC